MLGQAALFARSGLGFGFGWLGVLVFVWFAALASLLALGVSDVRPVNGLTGVPLQAENRGPCGCGGLVLVVFVVVGCFAMLFGWFWCWLVVWAPGSLLCFDGTPAAT